MPLLSILIVIISLQAMPWPENWWGWSPQFIVASTLGIHLVVVTLSFIVGQRIANTLVVVRGARGRVIRRYQQGKLYCFMLNVFCLCVSLGYLGWGHWVWNYFPHFPNQKNEPVLMPLGELAVILPFILTTVLSWLCYYPAERALRETSGLNSNITFYSRFGYVLFNFRTFSLFVLLPAISTALTLSFNRFLPKVADHWSSLLISFILIMTMFLFFPLLVPYFLGLVKMFPGEVRNRLELLALRCGFRYRDFLVWPTRATMANAMVIGVLPKARYVIFTDHIIDLVDPDGLDAICGHEIGHVAHGHIPFYALFLALSGSFAVSLTFSVFQFLKLQGLVVPEHLEIWMVPISLVVLGLYLFIVFGFISRRCERQADIFGAKSVSCNDPNCRDHWGKVLPDRVMGLCPTGIRTFANALDAVAGTDATEKKRWPQRILETIRAWQHGPAEDRIAYLKSLIDHPERERQFQKRFFAIKVVLVIFLIATTFLLANWIGWETFLKEL
jgi:STE24 endopeptidase